MISATKPGTLYPYFDLFANLLDGENNILKWNAMDILANLAAIDVENKFDCIFSHRYYDLLEEGSLITAGHVVENSGQYRQSQTASAGKDRGGQC